MNVAIVGDDAITGQLADVVARRGGSVVSAPDADTIVAIGKPALFELVGGGLEVPVLPIAAGEGKHVVSKPDASDALAAVIEGEARRTEHYQLGVSTDGTQVATALYDLTLVTEEPARISEYAVVGDGDALGTVRSDGIVAATPAGSAGYARSAGGPVLSPGSGLSVVPISPFTTHPEAWVVAEEVCVTVTRDDDVSVVADGKEVCSVGRDESVAVTRTDPVTLLRF
ncbi:NAD kinase [Halalkaliarchaeum sp. AArc-CO]|uniref:NAD(+)/NADH kinase n=1 Tax=unclassified Halalkaliarchaeum TaxID=2678344 RepID=UPI00217ECCBE|nr:MULTISPECIES: NAD(+)/NADH kinase [unclassified Halalkaliarchaeum]MDR5671909.1 NAD(+)/NADH kinase [Halalkaliarchaeum sp. AArc-GB]UWG51414.1 NAD kinase [Halalkaliarchaeum sp. AArc-CO]